MADLAHLVDERVGTPRVMQVTRATRRQLEYWVRSGYLHPDNAHIGRGVPLLWPPAEIAVAVRIVKLLNLGFLLPAAVDLARHPRNLHTTIAYLEEIARG